MKRILIETFTAAALLGAACTTPALADEAGSRHAALMPLREAPLQMASRRMIDPLPCGLLGVGRARPRTAPVLDAEPLLSVQGEVVDRSRRIRFASAAIERRLRVLDGGDGRVVTAPGYAPEVTVAAHDPVTVDARAIEASRVARAVGPLAIDAAVIRKSRLARALAAR